MRVLLLALLLAGCAHDGRGARVRAAACIAEAAKPRPPHKSLERLGRERPSACRGEP